MVRKPSSTLIENSERLRISFTGAVVVQTLLYYKVFPLDRPLSKLLVWGSPSDVPLAHSTHC